MIMRCQSEEKYKSCFSLTMYVMCMKMATTVIKYNKLSKIISSFFFLIFKFRVIVCTIEKYFVSVKISLSLLFSMKISLENIFLCHNSFHVFIIYRLLFFKVSSVLPCGARKHFSLSFSSSYVPFQ